LPRIKELDEFLFTISIKVSFKEDTFVVDDNQTQDFFIYSFGSTEGPVVLASSIRSVSFDKVFIFVAFINVEDAHDELRALVIFMALIFFLQMVIGQGNTF
jgi:hypothetical protein